MKASEIALLSALIVVGTLVSALPDWPATQPRIIVRTERAAAPDHRYQNVEYYRDSSPARPTRL